MNKLVIHHTYAQGVAFDISSNRNHGVLTDVTPGSGQFERSFLFDQPSSRIDVAPSTTLEHLRAIRVRVVFYWQPNGGAPHRHNLIEGFVSFALFIQPDGSLVGTIVDADGNWRGAVSQPGVVTPGSFHVADFIHDGINRCVLFIDGAQVSYADVRGPVRSVGPLGIAIGHWPDPPDNYTFEGYIAETQLFKYDALTEIHELLDPCCADLDGIRQMAGQLRADGWTKERLLVEFDALLKLGAEATARYRQASGADADQAVADSIVAMSAFRRRDAEGYSAAMARAVARARRTMPADDISDLAARAEKIVERVPIPLEDVRRLAESLCWGHALPEDLDELIERHMADDETHRPSDGPNRPDRPNR